MWCFVKEKTKVFAAISSSVGRKRRFRDWPRSVPAAREEAPRLQPLCSGEMSTLSLCINPQESSPWELLRVYTSRMDKGGSRMPEGKSHMHLITGSWTCMHSCMEAAEDSLFNSHSLSVITSVWVFSEPPHQVTMSWADTLWCAALCSALCAVPSIQCNALANAFTGNGEHQHHLDTIDRGPHLGPD